MSGSGWRRAVAWLAVGVVTSGASVGAAAAGEERRSPDGTAAVLEALADVQKELKALRDEVAQLRKAVGDLGRGGRPALPPPPAAVDLGTEPPLGSAEAPVAVVEFSEFQCPFCRRFYEGTFAQVKEAYVASGKVRYVFRDFPLPIHGEAKRAAVAAHCAGEQGAFWPMHDALFANQERLGQATYDELAASLRLDLAAFRSCLEQPDARKAVDGDLAYGAGIGVQGTPTFFIGRVKDGRLVNPQRIVGAQPLAAFSEAIDALLK
jgi:protein-disulfide isomerase